MQNMPEKMCWRDLQGLISFIYAIGYVNQLKYEQKCDLIILRTQRGKVNGRYYKQFMILESRQKKKLYPKIINSTRLWEVVRDLKR